MPEKEKAQCLTFVDWINEVGPKELARRLNLKVRTIYFWRTGDNCPKPAEMRRIRRMSRGRVTYEMIIDGPSASRKSS